MKRSAEGMSSGEEKQRAPDAKILEENKVFALAGVSTNPEKYGYEVFKTLLKHGYKVYPINPKYDSVDGERCYKSLKDLPEKPEVVVTVVPPAVTEQIVAVCAELGISTVWMPPGSWSDLGLKKCRDNNIQAIHDVCIVFAVKSLSQRREGVTP